MLDVKKLLAKILNSPFIVEEGTTTSGWTYRKWSNGTAECWGVFTVHPNYSTRYGQIYIPSSAYNMAFPSDLFLDAPTVAGTVDNKGGVGGISPTAVTASTFGLYIWNAVTYNATTRDILISLTAIGKWK